MIQGLLGSVFGGITNLLAAGIQFVTNERTMNSEEQIAREDRILQEKLEELRIDVESQRQLSQQRFERQQLVSQHDFEQDLEQERVCLQERGIELQIQLKGMEIGAATQRFEMEKKLQLALARYDYESRLLLANFQLLADLKKLERQQTLATFPLESDLPRLIHNIVSNRDFRPLLVLLSPLDENTPTHLPQLDFQYLERGLRNFCQSCGPSILFWGGGWRRGIAHRAEMLAGLLWQSLRFIPALIIETEIAAGSLEIRAAFWNLGEGEFHCAPIVSFPYRELLDEYAKRSAWRWQQDRAKWEREGKSLEEIQDLGGDDETNLQIWLAEKEALEIGAIPTQEYLIRDDCVVEFGDFLVGCYSLITGRVADAYYVANLKQDPLLPSMLPAFLEKFPDDFGIGVVETIASSYRELYTNLDKRFSYWTPELQLQLAQRLMKMPDKTVARSQIDYAIQAWLELRKSPIRDQHWVQSIKQLATTEDITFVQNLANFLSSIGYNEEVDALTPVLERLYDQFFEQLLSGRALTEQGGTS